jgi:putative hydrolase of the HAD superfamily
MSTLKGVKGVLFDCYDTLIEIEADEESLETYEAVSAWLRYQGVCIPPEVLRDEYRHRIKRQLKHSGGKHPEIRVEEIFRGICSDYQVWEIDDMVVGILTARTFRAASLRRFRAFPESIRLLEYLARMPKGIVSNGQRVFSEIELRYLRLHQHFNTIVFSSDVGFKKPDPRIFQIALDNLQLKPDEVMFIGDSFESDILGAQKVGMKTSYIREAWNLPDRSYQPYMFGKGISR